MPTNMHQGEGGQPSTRSRLEKISPDLFACFYPKEAFLSYVAQSVMVQR